MGHRMSKNTPKAVDQNGHTLVGLGDNPTHPMKAVTLWACVKFS